MTLWQRLSQGLVAFSLNTVISLMAGLVQARLVFHYLTPADYGSLNVYLSFFATGAILIGLGLDSVFTSEVARARGSGEGGWARFLVGRYATLTLISGLLLLSAFVGIGLWRDDAVLWSVMGAYLFISALTNIAYVLLHSTTRYRRVAAQSVARNLGRLALLATMPWWWSGQAIVGVALTYPLMESVALIASLGLSWSVWQSLRREPVGEHRTTDLARVLTRRGVYGLLSVPLLRVIDQLPIWFLTAMVGDAAVGAYAAARAAYLLVFSFFKSVETTLFPLVSEQAPVHPEQLRRVLSQARKYSLWLGLLVAGFVTITAPWLVRLIAGDAYTAAIPLLRLLVWGVVIHPLAQSQRPILYAIGEQRLQFVTHVVHAGLLAALLAVIIGWLGDAGAAWAILMAALLIAAGRQVVIQRLAPELSELWRNLFTIEDSDRRLWRALRQSARGRQR